MLSETHATAAQRDMPIREIIKRMRHDGCGGRAERAELMTRYQKAMPHFGSAMSAAGGCSLPTKRWHGTMVVSRRPPRRCQRPRAFRPSFQPTP
jgi:hypothetical protein